MYKFISLFIRLFCDLFLYLFGMGLMCYYTNRVGMSVIAWPLICSIYFGYVGVRLSNLQRFIFYIVMPLLSLVSVWLYYYILYNYMTFSIYYFISKFFYTYVFFSGYEIFCITDNFIYPAVFLKIIVNLFMIPTNYVLNNALVLFGTLLYIMILFALLLVIRGGAPRYRIEQISQHTFNILIPAAIIFVILFIIFSMLF